jgi:lysophospholipase L1-like esterase
MGRASRARRIAAYGGGGLGALGLGAGATFYGLLVGQSKLARRRIPAPESDPPATDGSTWRASGVAADEPILLAWLGDSLAAGYGARRQIDTPSVRMAIAVSAATHQPVRLANVAVVGSESSALPQQVAALADPPDVAVIVIGANDVTHRIKPKDAVRDLAAAVVQLRGMDAEVIVGTCPDLGTIRPIGQPLRSLVRRLSRNLAAAQTIAVVEAGGRTVSLGDLLGPLFSDRRDLFSDDQFHPSAEGYAEAADALLPSVLDALGLHTEARGAGALPLRRARPVARAAAQAAVLPGTEVAAAEVHGEPVGRRGRWARVLRRRPPAAAPDPESITADL